jgi:hypothetical protein
VGGHSDFLLIAPLEAALLCLFMVFVTVLQTTLRSFVMWGRGVHGVFHMECSCQWTGREGLRHAPLRQQHPAKPWRRYFKVKGVLVRCRVCKFHLLQLLS